MSDCDYLSSDREDEKTPSTSDVTIEESDLESADESIVRIRPKTKKRPVVIESDDDDDNKNDGSQTDNNNKPDVESDVEANVESDVETDDENDDVGHRAFSPRTRMSITGIRPRELTDDSSEIDYSDDDIVEQSKSETTSSDENLYKSAESTMEDKPTTSETSIKESSTGSTKAATTLEKQNLYSPAPPRYSTMFESAIKEKLSSTLHQVQRRSIKNESTDDSDLEICEKGKDATIEISSSDNEDNSHISLQTPPKLKPPLNLVQPKISTAISNNLTSTKKTSAKKTLPKQYVSQEFYKKEEKKLEDLKLDLSNAQRLHSKIATTLPDNGRQLSLRVDRLRTDVQIKSNYFNSLVVEDGAIAPLKEKQQQHQQKNPFFNSNAPNWEELSAAVNQIQPLHTGRVGLATFNNQKVLTVDRLKDLHGSLESCPKEDVLADDPKGLKVTLMDHQKHALAWMDWREKQKPRGGILADDMGLGKTLTMISLVVADKNSKYAEKDDPQEESDSEDEETKENHGWTSKGRRDYYHGNTLVVCPASLVNQWDLEVQTKLSRHKLTVCVHHGTKRNTKAKHLRTYDMVVTTYAIVSSEMKNSGALFGIKWRRIILDEAHVIRNHKAKLSLGVCALRGTYRWALTGTPVQNKEMDVYALLKFLRCTPFDNLAHWKKWIDNKSGGGQQRLNTVMKSLMLRRTKVQLQDKGELNCLPEKHINIIEVELDKDEMNVYQKIMIYSRTLFAQFLFQRAERNTDFMYRDQGNRPTFMQTKDPNGAYHKVHQKLKQLHNRGEEVQSHQILVLLLRLRQICCHPGLIDSMLEDTDGQNISSECDSTQPEFDILEQLNKLAITDTSGDLEEEHEPSHKEQVIAKASAKVLQRTNPVFDFKRPSSKMNKVFETLKKYVINTEDKAIVVSQWPTVLNILKSHIELQGIRTLSLNGKIPVQNRQAIINEFNDMNSGTQILLLSLTAGGVGLNLVGGNHLLLIDLHWNPQLEAQAQDRIYRVGQTKPVNIYKFLCKDTVEERIKALQDQKLAIANGILTGAKSSEGSKLTMDDLKGLFGM